MITLYRVKNIVNGMLYFGKTTLSPAERWSRHEKTARFGATWPLARAIRKYGATAFTVSVVTHVDTQAQANLLERALIAAYHTNDGKHGYNCTPGGDGRHGPLSEETKSRMRNAAQRPDVRKKTSAHWFGKGQHIPQARSDIATSQVVQLYLSGKSPREITRLLKFSGVLRRLRAAGIHIRTRSEVKLGRPRG